MNRGAPGKKRGTMVGKSVDFRLRLDEADHKMLTAISDAEELSANEIIRTLIEREYYKNFKEPME